MKTQAQRDIVIHVVRKTTFITVPIILNINEIYKYERKYVNDKAREEAIGAVSHC